jgi:nucleoid DNA-binding protein
MSAAPCAAAICGTGESLKIPATKAVRFKMGKHLREAAAGSKRKRAGKGTK